MALQAGDKLRAGALGQLTSSFQFTGSAAQTIPNITDTVVAFGTGDIGSAGTTSYGGLGATYVTRAISGDGHVFTIGVSGLWSVSTTVRWAGSGVAVGEKHIHVKDSLGLWHASSSIPGLAGSDITNHLSFVKYIEAGDTITVEAWQNSGGPEDLEFNSIWGVPRINLALVIGS